MTIKEFEENYCLHDSELTNLEYDSVTQTATVTIDFCSSERGAITANFQNVSKLKYDEDKGHGEFGNTILETQINKDGTFIFKQMDDDISDYYETIIKAENVEVTELDNQ